MNEPLILPYEGHVPDVADDAFVAPGCTLIGRVRLGAGASVWYGSVLRGDNDDLILGEGVNVQDGCVLHTDAGRPLVLHEGVSLGHGAIVHGAEVAAGALVGMRAVVLNGARVGRHALVAAGALVRPGQEVPPRTLVAGVPARAVREVTEEEFATLERTAANYRDKARRHRAALEAHAAAGGRGGTP